MDAIMPKLSPFLRCSVVLLALGAVAAARAAVEPFTVLHFSDTHVNPHLAREAPPVAVRGEETIRWLVGEVGQPQNVPGFDASVSAPDFAVVTGDITEYGVIDDTWQIAERALGALPCPWYAVPGNHDNTWVALYQVMRKRHGGANHSLDHQGWHFAFLSSASPQEPVPTLDATTRAWLKADLDKLAPHTPVVLAMHHSPEIGEYANPAEMDTFIDFVRDYNVQLMLVGHGHSPRTHDALGIPAIEGGSTFGGNSGYGLLTIAGERIHYAYRWAPGGENTQRAGKWRKLYDAPMARRARV
ncbi:MAG TPA: metallophosphoesterase, partial [Mycobacterium sp.]